MSPDNAARWWQETEALRLERMRRAQEDAERCIERLHREYFEPFDRLLERKAEYALKMEQEKGEIPPWLMQEIETLEKFRTYVDRLERITEDQAFAWFMVLKREIYHLERRCNDLNSLAISQQENEMFMGEMLINTLERIKKNNDGTGANSPRQD